MRRIFTFFLTFLLGVFVTALYAQTHTVSGTVIDKDANEPLIGANVLIKGTTIGTVTDLDGKYTLQAGDKDIYNPQIEMFAHFKTKSSFHKTKGII